MDEVRVFPIGYVSASEDGFRLIVKEEYRQGLTGLSGFDTVQVLWWCSGCDSPECRGSLLEKKPYRKGPDSLGVFATRTPCRPNPIAVSNCKVVHMDEENGIMYLAWIDALDGTPVLDIKPYTPSVDRVREVQTPAWCADWPAWAEDSEAFDWSQVFAFSEVTHGAD